MATEYDLRCPACCETMRFSERRQYIDPLIELAVAFTAIAKLLDALTTQLKVGVDCELYPAGAEWIGKHSSHGLVAVYAGQRPDADTLWSPWGYEITTRNS